MHGEEKVGDVVYVIEVRRCFGVPIMASFAGWTERRARTLAYTWCWNTRTFGFRMDLREVSRHEQEA